MIDYSRYYRAYAEMKDTLNGDFAHEYLVSAMADADKGNDELSGNAYNRVIDMEWVEMIEGKLPYMEKAIDEQRRFIEEHREVDRIDKVKQVGKDAVQHLTQHANLIMALEPDGSVVPERLLNVHREDSFATYENRFLHTLIFKTISFVEARFRALQDAPNDSASSMKMERDLMLNNQKFGFSLSYNAESHDRAKVSRDEDISGLTDYERIERIRMKLDDFCGTDLIKSLKNCIAVKSPINKTNCIKQDPAFKQCYELWVFIEGYRKSGYVLEKNVFEGQMPEHVQQDVYDVMAFQHFVATIDTNNALREKLHAEYLAENERRAAEANKPEEEMARYIEDKIYEARREEMALRLKEVREREVVIAKLTAELEQAKEQIRIRDVKIKEQESMISALKKELEEAREELRKAQVRIMELEAEVEELKAHIAELEAKIVQLEARIAELEAQVAAQLATIATLEGRIAELEGTIAELKAEIEQLKATIEEQKQMIAERDARIEELEEQVATQLATIATLENRIAELESTIAKLKAEIEKLNATIEEQKVIIAERDAKIAEQEGEISELNSRVENLNGTVATLTAENTELKAEIESNRKTIAEQADVIAVKAEALAEADDTNKKMTADLSNLQSNYDDTVQKYTAAQQEIGSLNNTLKQSNEQRSDLEHQLRVHLNTISAKEAIIATLNDEKSALTEQVSHFDEIHARKKAESDRALDKVSRIEAENVALGNSLRTQVAAMTAKNAEIEELREKLDVATADKAAEAETVRSKYEAQLLTMQAEHEAQINSLKAEFENKLSEINQRHEKKLSQMQSTYEVKIDTLENEKIAACTFSDSEKYTVRLNAEKKAIQKDYDAKLAVATKKARKFVRKARVLVDDMPEALLKLEEANDYK